MMDVSKLKDVDKIIDYYKDSEFIHEAYISKVDTGVGKVTLNLNSNDELYNEVLKEVLGGITLIKVVYLKCLPNMHLTKMKQIHLNQHLKWLRTLAMELFIQHLLI